LDVAAPAFLSDLSDFLERPLAIVWILLVAGRKSGLRLTFVSVVEAYRRGLGGQRVNLRSRANPVAPASGWCPGQPGAA
jgi:hypothetical protein